MRFLRKELHLTLIITISILAIFIKQEKLMINSEKPKNCYDAFFPPPVKYKTELNWIDALIIIISLIVPAYLLLLCYLSAILPKTDQFDKLEWVKRKIKDMGGEKQPAMVWTPWTPTTKTTTTTTTSTTRYRSDDSARNIIEFSDDDDNDEKKKEEEAKEVLNLDKLQAVPADKSASFAYKQEEKQFEISTQEMTREELEKLGADIPLTSDKKAG
ncbi:unnamed protein product [Caenorhabditis angaria]|uniref:Uncharacterized protein n=1 Tax=Caenorhabditis angaria TaxID=860376 RepID=A0A9P1I3S1_9PELO|nr:unnamed protein product [Caenorhabditis angaria]